MQEPHRIEQWLRRFAKAFADQLLGDLGRALTFGMSTHAIAGDQQRTLLGRGDSDPVLIGLARSFEADFGSFEAQAGINSFG